MSKLVGTAAAALQRGLLGKPVLPWAGPVFTAETRTPHTEGKKLLLPGPAEW